MANNERNALAELSEFLKGEAEIQSESFREKAIEKFGEVVWNRHVERKLKFGRASRIISELVKVETPYDLVGLIGKCRAIAAEGANER